MRFSVKIQSRVSTALSPSERRYWNTLLCNRIHLPTALWTQITVNHKRSVTKNIVIFPKSYAIFCPLNALQDGRFGRSCCQFSLIPIDNQSILTAEQSAKRIHLHLSTPLVTFRPLIVLQRYHLCVPLVNSL